MPYKDKEIQLEHNRNWKKNNKEHCRKYMKEYMKTYHRKLDEEIKQYIRDYKLSRGCSVCGYNKCATALEFHHNGDKEFNISQVHWGLEKVKKEMEKCVVLCANCHRELHNQELLT